MVSRLSMKTRKPNPQVEHMASLKLRIEDDHQNAMENSRGENSNFILNVGWFEFYLVFCVLPTSTCLP